MHDNPTEGRRSGGWVQDRTSNQLERFQGWENLCDELGHSPAEVALAWVLHQRAVTSAIIGPRTPEQLASSLKALDLSLSQEVLARLDELFPGPGGPAPEAYSGAGRLITR
jgi:aryl-alcohol dehydrogenase-like predicted oxidoreductase